MNNKVDDDRTPPHDLDKEAYLTSQSLLYIKMVQNSKRIKQCGCYRYNAQTMWLVICIGLNMLQPPSLIVVNEKREPIHLTQHMGLTILVNNFRINK